MGLGNMWRFPYMVSANGGAWFLLVYLVLTLGIGLPLLLAEIAIGRRSRRAPVGAFRALEKGPWVLLGYFQIGTAILVSAFYTVIAGWTIRYAVDTFARPFPADPAAGFGAVASGAGAYGYALLYLGVILGVLLLGLRRGIERAALLLMPTLVLLLIALAAWAATLDGVSTAYRFYLLPRLGAFDVGTVVAAAGQAFFSLGLGMGVMLTFGSYLAADEDLVTQASSVVLADIFIAVLAGFVTIPLVFLVAGGIPVDAASTTGTLFISIPGALSDLGASGRILGTVFFSTLLLAALTSGIPTMEMVTVSLMEELGWTRIRSVFAATAGVMVLAAPPAFSIDILSLMDRLAGEVFMVLGGLALTIFAGWRFSGLRGELQKGSRRSGERSRTLIEGLLRFVVPLAIAAVLILALRPAVP